MEAGQACVIPPSGPCKRCKFKKQGCSLMPQNPDTSKTDRRALSEARIREFRMKQVGESCAKVRKGKRCAANSPDAGEPEGPGSDPLPLTSLAALGTLTLDSSGSSAANTPADSPATLPQPPLPERPAPAPPSAPKASGASRDSAGKSASSSLWKLLLSIQQALLLGR